MFVKVAVNVPTDTLFSYRVPPPLAQMAHVGGCVLVSFGSREQTGFIVDIEEKTDIATERIKDVMAILDNEPLIDAHTMRFYSWLSQYYVYPLGKVLHELLPFVSKRRGMKLIEASEQISTDISIPQRQKDILTHLSKRRGAVSLERIRKLFPDGDMLLTIRAMERRGLIKISTAFGQVPNLPSGETCVRLTGSAPQKKINSESLRDVLDFLAERGATPIRELKEKFPNIVSLCKRLQTQRLVEMVLLERHQSGDANTPGKPRHLLNDEQREAYEELAVGVKSGKFATYLLHGVTGSGKTEVYLRVVEEVLKDPSGSVLYMVPEIALTPGLESSIRARFNVSLAVIHSGIFPRERYEQWQEIARGNIRLVIGARSAIFAPIRDLRAIIVDEEHDGSYKQEERMRYSARDAAIVRAKMNSAIVVLGSATPSVQSFYNAATGKYRYLRLKNRVENRPLPVVDVVDLRSGGSEIPLISEHLREAMEMAIAAGRQVILFLNRRGFTSTTLCPACGETVRCPACDVAMTLHRGKNKIECHLCGFSRIPFQHCPHCGFSNLVTYGAGTEKLVAEVAKLFPQARVERMDSDTMKDANAYHTILKRFGAGDVDILVGTQMVAKGHDFPNVTLVGVVLAEIGMGLPDFRATEKSFQFLMQVAGRSGRGETPGKVIIQSLNPHHHAIRQALEHSYEGFYQREIADRRRHCLPPFQRMVMVCFQKNSKEAGTTAIESITKEICACRKDANGVEFLGPTPAPIFKARGKYHWQVIIKGRDVEALGKYARLLLQLAKREKLQAVADVDPVNFL